MFLLGKCKISFGFVLIGRNPIRGLSINFERIFPVCKILKIIVGIPFRLYRCLRSKQPLRVMEKKTTIITTIII